MLDRDSSRPDISAALTMALGELLRDLGGRATGIWRVEREELVQVQFLPALDLDEAIAASFAAATRRVPRSQRDLGIVVACETGEPAVSRTADLPETTGSGRWLRSFKALRSVAVPLRNAQGEVGAVWSVALAEPEPADEIVAREIQSRFQALREREPGCQDLSGK